MWRLTEHVLRSINTPRTYQLAVFTLVWLIFVVFQVITVMAHAYVEATEANVNDLVASGKVVVDAFADWCGPCRGIAPKFAAIAAEYAPKGLTFVKVDVDSLEGG